MKKLFYIFACLTLYALGVLQGILASHFADTHEGNSPGTKDFVITIKNFATEEGLLVNPIKITSNGRTINYTYWPGTHTLIFAYNPCLALPGKFHDNFLRYKKEPTSVPAYIAFRSLLI